MKRKSANTSMPFYKKRGQPGLNQTNSEDMPSLSK